MTGRSDPLPGSDCCAACQLTDATITGYAGWDGRTWRKERLKLAKPDD